MTITNQSLGDLKEAAMEDAWYEMEGAYEVYGIGRCRFVLLHCRMAMLIGIVLLANVKGIPLSEGGIERTARDLNMPKHLIDSCSDIDRTGRYPLLLKKREDEQQYAATILSQTLEVFEWIRAEMEIDRSNMSE
ncbi:MAG TPA: hypothetical protein VGK23_07080 [Methanomassiliicoccales archaeon]